ncbi:hypothetical protein D5086_007483 [Populus alba]|uniref:Uncharacterized protein n=1 Tax=Populus alba TaxID=43335 RepID=A0ACC4CPQ4_POPAL
MVPCTNDVTVNLTVSYFTNVKEHPKETDPVREKISDATSRGTPLERLRNSAQNSTCHPRKFVWFYPRLPSWREHVLGKGNHMNNLCLSSYVPSPMHPNLGEAAETVRGYGQAGEVQGKDNLSNRFS